MNYKILRSHYEIACSKFIPKKRVPFLQKTSAKWINKDVKTAINLKYKAFARLQHSSTLNLPSLRKAYNKVSRHVKKLVKLAVLAYECSIVEKSKSNPRLLYSYINQNKKCNDSIRTLQMPSGELTSDKSAIANLLNQQFFSAFSSPEMSSTGSTASPVKPSLFQLKRQIFVPENIDKIFGNLDKRKPPGSDGFHPHVLSECRGTLSLPFAIIFEQSYVSGHTPSHWKEASITPIFKKGDKTIAANYRPISLTSVPCKCIERLIRDEMLNFLNEWDLISKSQHGFVPARSCITNLLETFDTLTTALANNHEVVLLLLDFAKAFDKVCHELLTQKLKTFGFDNLLINWITSFLANRKQRVMLGKAMSDWCQVLSGVPQGSVLGPLLFLIYINDMPDITFHPCKLFADDTKILATTKSDLDREKLQCDIEKLVEWSAKWKMCFHEDKCKVMYINKKKLDLHNTAFTQDSKNPNWETDSHNHHRLFTMRDSNGSTHTLTETTIERDLGIIIDNKLNWQNQIDHAISKASIAFGSLKRSFKFWTPLTFCTLYKTFVRPHLEYGAQIWNPHLQQDTSRLERVQRRMTKIVPQLRSLPYAQRLAQMDLTSLAERRERGDLIQFFKIHHNFNRVSWLKPLEPLHSTLTDGPAGSTRGHSYRFHSEKPSNSASRENFFTNRTIHKWNALPPEVVEAPSINSFKNRLDKLKKNTL